MVAARGSLLERAKDTLLGVVSPRRAFLRGHFRLMEGDTEYRDAVLASIRAMGYKASTTGRNETPWSQAWGPRSADAEILEGLEPIRNKSRELKRNDGLASGLLKSLPREVVGSGIVPKSSAGDPEVRAACNAVFTERFKNLFPADAVDFYEHQLLVVAKLIEDGECWIKEAKADPREPLWFEVVEADRVDTPLDSVPQDPQGRITAGIERDRWGRVVAYWISKKHPGDQVAGKTTGVMPTVPALVAADFVRVGLDEAKHQMVTDRPGQSRGVPWLHAVVQDFRDLDLLMLAVMKRFQISASLAIFLESEDSLGDIFATTAKEYGYQLDQDIEPGMIFKLQPGEKVSTIKPDFPIPDLERLVILLARRIGAAIGVCWQTVLSDFSTSNYSSARTDLLRDRRLYRFIQHKLISGHLTWIWTRVLEDARLLGDVRLRGVSDEDIAAVGFIAPGWEWVDPQNQAAAVKEQLAIGLTSLRREAAALGRDWMEIQDERVEELARWRQLCEEHGLDPSVGNEDDGGQVIPLLGDSPKKAAA